MKLPFLNKKKEPTGFYLALLLNDEKATAVILHEQLGKVKILNSHEEFFSTSIDHVHQEELIDIIDKTLSKAEEALPPSIETHDTVFGVKENWVEPDTKKIKKLHLTQLKKVCDTLDLTPIGFMVTSEAITHLLQEEEGAPLSAIVAELGKTGVILTLLRGGKKIETIHGAYKEFSPVATVDMLLKHFTVPVLPARLILSSSHNTEHLAQQFISHQWSQSLPFLHVPQVTVLPKHFDGRAVAFGAAAQMGFELLESQKAYEPITQALPEEPDAQEASLDIPEESNETVPYESNEDSHEVSPIATENFGFVLNKDISELAEDDIAHQQEEIIHHPKQHTTHQTNNEPEDDSMFERDVAQDDEDEELVEKHTPKDRFLGVLATLKPSVMRLMKTVPLPKMTKNNRLLVPGIIVAGVLVLLIGIGAFYFYGVTATVELTVKPNMVNKTVQATFSSGAGNDFSKDVIAANSINASVDGTATTNATGKKDLGEKAKGTVTVFNNDSNAVTLNSGTEIKASNGDLFTLDKDISIASSSGDIFSGTKPGTTDVSVTAEDIGSDQNIPSDTKFSIGDNASLAAKNDNAFSGGSKKTVTVVSQNDLATLRSDLPKNLQSKAKDAISQKASSSQAVLPFYGTDSLEKASYDKKIDDEAKTVTLTATVVFDGLAYDQNDLQEYAKTVIKRDQSADVSFADNSIKAIVNDTKQTDDKDVQATVAIEAGILPNIDTQEVTDGIQGKSYGQALDKLGNLPQVASSTIKFSPWVPIPQLFPSLPKHISVVLKTNS